MDIETIILWFFLNVVIVIIIIYLTKKIYEAKYKAKFEEWIAQEEARIRKDSKIKSFNALIGKIGEIFAPSLLAEKYSINPEDFRFLGSPVDYIAFKGLDGNEIPEIIFFEIKTGRGQQKREIKVEEAVKSYRVKYVYVDLGELIKEVKDAGKKMIEEGKL
jgi:predicted Holliday junction resolvase-like endonuclease